MKKRIKYLLLILLLTTGCTCEYNLTIDGNTYQEKIILTSENDDEKNDILDTKTVVVDKNITGGDIATTLPANVDTYEIQKLSNSLILKYDFTKNNIINSMAVSKCYNKLTVTNYEGSLIISTSPNAICYDTVPPLTKVKVNITIMNKNVKSHNADSVNNNTYTWNITRNNASTKSINLVIDKDNNSNIIIDNNKENNNNNDNNKINNKKKDYTMYIFAGILLVALLSGYFIYNRITKRNDMDDI